MGRYVAALATVTAMLLTTPTWGADAAQWQKVVEAAKKAGRVTIYSGQGSEQLNELNGLAARFKKEYGITVQVVRAVDAELLPRGKVWRRLCPEACRAETAHLFGRVAAGSGRGIG